MPAARPPISLADAHLPTDRPFTLAAARQRGVTSADLSKLIRIGALHRLFQGVYAVQLDGSAIDRARAVALAVGDSAIVTGRSAAWLYGIDLDRQSADYRPQRHLSYTRDLHRYEPDDLREVDGCRVTTPLRTACDLGRREYPQLALGALDALLRLGDFTHDQLQAQVPRFRGRPGVGQLRELAPLADSRSDSLGASALRMHWIKALLPVPQLQVPIVADGGVRIELDLADPTVKYAAVLAPDEVRSDSDDDESSAPVERRTAARWIPALQDGWFVDVFGPEEIGSWGGARNRLAEGHRRASDRHAPGAGPDASAWDARSEWDRRTGWGDSPEWDGALRWGDRDDLLVEDPCRCRECGRRIERWGVDREPTADHWL